MRVGQIFATTPDDKEEPIVTQSEEMKEKEEFDYRKFIEKLPKKEPEDYRKELEKGLVEYWKSKKRTK